VSGLTDDEGAATLIGFSIAAVVFLAAVSLLFLFARTTGPVPGVQSAADPNGQSRAEGVLETFAGSGTEGGAAGWGGAPMGSTWTPTASPTSVRPGLLDSGTGLLSLAKVGNLERAPRAAAADGLLNYDEARDALALSAQALDFHLRFRPVLASIDAVPAPALPLAVNYVSGTNPLEQTALIDPLLAAASMPVMPGTLGLPSSPGCAPAVDVLVIGTGYDPTAAPAWSPLDGAAVADWVENCGGTLLMLGSSTPCDACLDALRLPAPATPSSGPLRQADASHPLLSIPNVLAASSYVGFGSPWDLTNIGVAFAPIVGDPAGQPLILASGAGAFGAGQVLLVRMDASAPVSGSAGTEPSRLMENLLAHFVQALFLDYGPSVPSAFDAQAAVETTTVCLPALPGSIAGCAGGRLVTIQVAAYVFPRIG
jgi:hypothetical protein